MHGTDVKPLPDGATGARAESDVRHHCCLTNMFKDKHPRYLTCRMFLVMASLMAAVAVIGVAVMMLAPHMPTAGMPMFEMVLYAIGLGLVAISAFGIRVFWVS